MCLAIPAKVIELKNQGKKAIVEQPGTRKEVFNTVINAGKGEWVLIQQGFIVERISEKEAKEFWKAGMRVRRANFGNSGLGKVNRKKVNSVLRIQPVRKVGKRTKPPLQGRKKQGKKGQQPKRQRSQEPGKGTIIDLDA